MESKNRPVEPEKRTKEIDFQWILINALVHWKFFLAVIFICLLGGFLYIRYSTPVYNVYASIVLKDNKRGGMGNSELSVFEGMGLVNSDNNVDNEVEILHSRNLVEDVARELGLYTRYEYQGRIKNRELYPQNRGFLNASPLYAFLDAESASSIKGVVSLKISLLETGAFAVEGSYGRWSESREFPYLPAIFETPVGEILLQPIPRAPFYKNEPVYITIGSPLQAAKAYLGKFGAEPANKNTSVVRLSMSETIRSRGEDFLSKLIEMYNQDAMDDKNKAARNTLTFIDERLALINKDLNEAELDMENYRRDNRMTDIALESQLFLSEDNEYEKQWISVETQLQLVAYLEKALLPGGSGKSSLLPTATGIPDIALSEAIRHYNAGVLEKERLASYSSPETPAMARLNEKVNILREQVVAGIEGLKAHLSAKQQDIRNSSSRYGAYLDEIPQKDREYREKVRQQQIKSNLYVSLLKQKEEAELSLAVTAPSAKVIENPLANNAPVSPRKMLILLVSLFLGCFLPVLYFLLKENINYKIEGEQSVRSLTSIPIAAVLPLDKKKKPIVVSASSSSPIAEMFRLLRANIQFAMTEKREKVILVTSSVSGEGKTFVSINLALTFALKYKTLVVGLDIRRPKLADYMQLGKHPGIVSYLSGDVSDPDSIICPSGLHPNLDVIMAGTVPPNPNELLMEPALDNLFAYLRKKYDYIIIDTSPVGSVSDSFLLDRVSDMGLFVVREGVTPKNCISLANNIQTERRIKNLFITLNGVGKDKASRYGYGRSYGYGYGYGYGYSSNKS